MWKLIFLGLFIWLAVTLVRHYLRQNQFRPRDETVQDNAEAMVRCEVCAVHLPRSEAIMQDRRYYCSKAHLPNK